MGQVGGNGSVVWQNQHRPKKGKFKCKTGRGGLKRDELGLGEELDVWGHDDIPFEDIGKDPAPGLEPGLDGFQRPGYFLVRLRFDGAEADAISKWFETIGRNLPPTVIRLIRVGATIILAINVKALQRDEPDDGIPWPNLPFEIRYDW
jgi:hypothetical protein